MIAQGRRRRRDGSPGSDGSWGGSWGGSGWALDGRVMTSLVSRKDPQISSPPDGVRGKRERVVWGKERIWDLGHLRASVVWVPAWGRVPPWAWPPLRGWGNRMELGPFGRAGCGGQCAKRRHRSLAPLGPRVLGPPSLRGSVSSPPDTPPASAACPQVTSEQSASARVAKPPGRGAGAWTWSRFPGWLHGVFPLPWPCLLTRGPSYLLGVNAWGRENKPPPAAPSTIGCFPGWQWPVAAGTVASWLLAGPQHPDLHCLHLPPARGSHAVLPRGQGRPGTWQIWGGRTTGSQFLSLAEAHPEPLDQGSPGVQGNHWSGPCSTTGVLGPRGERCDPFFELSPGPPGRCVFPEEGNNPPVFLSLCTLEPLRNPNLGLCPSVCAAPGRATLKGGTPQLQPRSPHSRAALQTPVGNQSWHHPGDGVGR